MDKRIVYLDHAATTATRPEVVVAMLPYFTENFEILPVFMTWEQRINQQ